MRTKLKAVAAMVLLAIAAQPALATFHLMKVVEVFPGTAAAPNAQYVVIQMYTSGQNLLNGHTVTVYNAAGTAVGTFTFTGNVSSGANQAKVLIATTEAQAFFGVNANLIMSASLLKAGGKVCFETIDCVAWGAYTGPATGVGTPFNAPGGLQSGRATIRRLDIAGSPSVLDATDDTDNSANDFVFGLPAPRNNAGVIGTIPSATCGNGALEGLEQCDDHNLVNGDGCSSTCAVDQVILRRSSDFDGDGKSDLLWRNGVSGSNSIWRSANSTLVQVVRAITDVGWTAAGVGDFNGDGKADILWNHKNTGANALWYSANHTIAQNLTTVANLTWKIVGVGDFDGDGKSDILWRNGASGSNSIWRSGNSAQVQTVRIITDVAWVAAGVGDFNGDGKADILWNHKNTGANALWYSANSATAQNLTTVTNLAWKIVGVGDFDGDGKSDILWRNSTTGANSYWRSGNSATQGIVRQIADVSWKAAAVSDYNGDGKADVVWRHSSTGANAVWYSANHATAQNLTGVANLTWKIMPIPHP